LAEPGAGSPWLKLKSALMRSSQTCAPTCFYVGAFPFLAGVTLRFWQSRIRQFGDVSSTQVCYTRCVRTKQFLNHHTSSGAGPFPVLVTCMRQIETHRLERPTVAAVVAPAELQQAYCVLLEAMTDVRLERCVTTVEALLSLAGEQPPGLVLLEADRCDGFTRDQVRRIREAWPMVRCVVLVERAGQQELALEAGADVALLKGASPKRLLDAIRAEVV